MSKKTPHSLQHEAEHESSNRSKPVYFYVTILFAAAFLLLLLSYFMEVRANQSHVENLTDSSTTAIQSMDNLLDQQKSLQEQVYSLTDQLEDLQDSNTDQMATLQEEILLLEEALSQAQQEAIALDWLSYMEALYQQEDWENLLIAMDDFQKDELDQYLSIASIHPDYTSPAARYWALEQAIASK